jgi:hypothetical protein
LIIVCTTLWSMSFPVLLSNRAVLHKLGFVNFRDSMKRLQIALQSFSINIVMYIKAVLDPSVTPKRLSLPTTAAKSRILNCGNVYTSLCLPKTPIKSSVTLTWRSSHCPLIMFRAKEYYLTCDIRCTVMYKHCITQHLIVLPPENTPNFLIYISCLFLYTSG